MSKDIEKLKPVFEEIDNELDRLHLTQRGLMIFSLLTFIIGVNALAVALIG